MSEINDWKLKNQGEEEFLLERLAGLEDEVIVLNKRNQYLEREVEIWKQTAKENQKAVSYWHKESTEKTRGLLRKIEKLKAKLEGVQKNNGSNML